MRPIWTPACPSLGVYIADGFLQTGQLQEVEAALLVHQSWARVSRSYEPEHGGHVVYSERLLETRRLRGPLADLVVETRSSDFLASLEAIAGHQIVPIGRTEFHGLQLGDDVEWHSDRGMLRRFALVVYLCAWNATWGGELVVRVGAERVRLVPQRNRAVLLDLAVGSEHCVERVSGPGTRLTLTSWYGHAGQPG